MKLPYLCTIKMRNTMKTNVNNIIGKSVKQALREDMLKNACGFVNRNKTFKSKKSYNRKDNKNIVID